MHSHCPWILTWDDHEVDNNYANDVPEDSQPREAFLERRSNAYQAYYESMPLRISSLPKGSKMQMYRTVPFGRLAQFTVLDTRQYRTDQPCGDGTKKPCEGVYDSKATIMGDQQEAWFKGQPEQFACPLEYCRESGPDGAYRCAARPGRSALDGSMERLRSMP